MSHLILAQRALLPAGRSAGQRDDFGTITGTEADPRQQNLPRRWSPEAVQFFKDLHARSTKARWSAHKAFYETSVREPMATLIDELGGNPARDGSPVPGRDVRFRADESPDKTAACSASCWRVDERLDVHYRRPVDCL